MQNILITGVNGGMGSSTAKLFKEKGYNVIGIDKNEKSDLDFIDYYPCDITIIENITAVYEKIAKKIDSINTIIHFAGIYNMDSLIEIENESFNKIFEINFFGVYKINKIFFPLLKKDSRIILTSSELAPLDPLPFTGLYAITKTAIEKYAISLRMELNLLGIKVIVIRPGAVKTTMLAQSVSALNSLCEKTKLYKYNSQKFKQIVDSVETKNILPIKIAKTAFKASTKKNPKYLYAINNNFLLKLLNILPDRLQVKIICKILRKSK